MLTEFMEHADTLFAKLSDEQRKQIADNGYDAAKPHVQAFMIDESEQVLDEVVLELCGLCQTFG